MQIILLKASPRRNEIRERDFRYIHFRFPSSLPEEPISVFLIAPPTEILRFYT